MAHTRQKSQKKLNVDTIFENCGRSVLLFPALHMNHTAFPSSFVWQLLIHLDKTGASAGKLKLAWQ